MKGQGFKGRPVGGTTDRTPDGPRCKGCGLLLDGLDCKAAGRCQARVDVWEKLPAIHKLMLAMNQDARTDALVRGRQDGYNEARKVARASWRAPGTT